MWRIGCLGAKPEFLVCRLAEKLVLRHAKGVAWHGIETLCGVQAEVVCALFPE